MIPAGGDARADGTPRAWIVAGAVAAAIAAWELVVERAVAPAAARPPAEVALALAGDALLALLLARAALAVAARVGPRLLPASPPAALVLPATLAALAFALLLVPAAVLRARALALVAQALSGAPTTGDVDALAPPSAAGGSWLCSSAVAAPGAPGAWAELLAAARTMLLLQVAAVPAFVIGLAAARRGPGGARHLAIGAWGLVAAVALGAAGAAAWPSTPPAVAIGATTCPEGAPRRSYEVSAIAVDLALDRHGDHDPGAALYVLDDAIPALRERERLPLHERTVAGLADDPMQPLVLRAAAGECVTVRFTNRLADGPAAFHVDGLPWVARGPAGRVAGAAAAAAPGATIAYDIRIPDTREAERAYRVHDGFTERGAHGLFGALVVEPRDASWRDVATGAPLTRSSWQAIVETPAGAFREFVVFHHAVAGVPALNGRSEPLRRRLATAGSEALAYSSYTHGDPATPILRSYLGEPTKLRVLHGGGSGSHAFDLRGGGTRWEHRPKVGPPLVAFGLSERPPLGHAMWFRSDAQALDPGSSHGAQIDCGAGGCQRAPGDLLLRCRIPGHAEAGEWGLWRVYDTRQPDLAPLPGRPPPPAPVTSRDLVGRVVDGKRLVPAARLRDAGRERPLEAFVEAQLPPPGRRLHALDATTWDWVRVDGPEGPLYLGEPEAASAPAAAERGQRPAILFNPVNGRYAWPLFRPHPGERPPFPGAGHTPAPWRGEWADAARPDGVCPVRSLVEQGDRERRVYSVGAVGGELVAGDRERAPATRRVAARAAPRPNDPYDPIPRGALVLRAQVLDCVDVLYVNDAREGDAAARRAPDVLTHFVSADPQASDGIAAGLAYSQHAEPYRASGRVLARAAAPGDTAVEVSHARGLRPGVFIGVGLGEGRCPGGGDEGAPPDAPPADAERCTEIRRIARIDGATLELDRPLRHPHRAGEFADVEFVRFLWYAVREYGFPLVRDPRAGAPDAVRPRRR